MSKNHFKPLRFRKNHFEKPVSRAPISKKRVAKPFSRTPMKVSGVQLIFVLATVDFWILVPGYWFFLSRFPCFPPKKQKPEREAMDPKAILEEMMSALRDA